LFEREGAVLRELRHHGVPAIYATFRATWEGAEAAFLAMEYVEGVSIAEMIAERRHVDREAVLDMFAEHVVESVSPGRRENDAVLSRTGRTLAIPVPMRFQCCRLREPSARWRAFGRFRRSGAMTPAHLVPA